jgi:PAS domain S-box-containing protein
MSSERVESHVEVVPPTESGAHGSLRHSEEQFRLHYQNDPMPIYVWQRVDGEFVLRDCNRAARRATRDRIARLMGAKARELYLDRPDIVRDLEACVENKTPVRREMGYRLRTTGRELHVSVCYVFIPPDLVLVHVEDISERTRAEAALRESEREFRAMFELAGTGQAQADPATGRLLRVNDKLCEILGYARDELLQMTIQQVTHPDDRQRDRDAFRRLARGDTGAYAIEKRYVRKDGEVRWAHVNVTLLRSENGRALHTHAIIQDVTDRKQAEERTQALQSQLLRMNRVGALGELAATLSHELGQPLGAIGNYVRGCLDALRSNDLGREELLEVLRRVERLTTNTSETLGRIRHLACKHAPRKSRVNVNQLINEVAALLEPEARRRDVELKVRLQPDLPRVAADGVQVQQVVLNLMRNALDAVQRTDRRVVTVRSARCGEDEIEVRVSDSGPGLPDCVEQLFEPFVTTKPGGVGLGLPICRSIVESHGGRLWAEPGAERGATFRFTLPVGRGEPRHARRSNRPCD